MGLTASLDIGSEKMVMAVASEDNHGDCRLMGIKMIALQGVEDGIVVDRSRVKAHVQYLLKELAGDKEVDCLNVCLGGKALRASEHKVNVPLQRKTVKENDLSRAWRKCLELVSGKSEEVVDMLPIAYAVDRGSQVTNPIGKTGRTLDVRYRVYTANEMYLSDVKKLLMDCGVAEVNVFPAVHAYMEALNVYEQEKRLALIDMGAMHTGVMIFRGGMLEHEVSLPLGTRTIERDIMCAFRLDNLQQARKIKHTYGMAMRSLAKNEKIQIPEAKKQIEKRDLAKVIQCRLEELLEGSVYQLQQWRFTEAENEIRLTGGGSSLPDTEVLLSRLSGQKVVRAKAEGIQSSGQEILSAPACLAALGLLFCEHMEPEEEKGGIGGWLADIFR